MAQTFDICIRGTGIVGKTLALLLARERLKVALLPAPGPKPPAAADVRAYALNAASRKLLESLRSWPGAEHATAVRSMQVQGDRDGAVHFDAATQGVEALAWIVDVPALEARLAEALRYQPQVEMVDAPVPAALTVVCEGRASSTREEFGVGFQVTPYGQHASATRLQCEQVAPLMALPPEEFAQKLQMASRESLGSLTLSAERAAWPLQLAKADRWCGSLPSTGKNPRSWVLAGDAAHNVHPLAGQGLNLGLADAQALASALHGRDYWRSVADVRLLRGYERERKAALLPMGLATDGLQQLFSRQEGSLQALRNWGMKGFELSGPLKHFVARQAMGNY